MGKRISELPTVTALGDNDVAIFNHIDTSQSEPTTTTSKITVSNLKQTLGINGKIDSTEIGAAGGVAELDGNGRIPSAQLPSYVDDVIEGYYDGGTDRFYTESTFEHVITPASDISWVDIAANKSYRWTGSVYVRVDEGVQLGETSGSAYRGDRGKTAYDFSQNPATATPSMDGTGVAGSSGKWAREDHVHPKDTTKADKVASATNGNLAGLDSDGNLTDSGNKPSDFLTSHQDISGKADKVSGATNGNVATLDASGNLSDSGKILGKSVPSDAVFTDTNTKVTQTNTTGSADYRLLLSANANDTTETTTARKSTNFKANPSTGELTAKKLSGVTINEYLTGTGTAGQDKGSGATDRYVPSKWTFNTGVTPADGDIITIKIPVAGGTYGVYISVDNGTTYKPVALSGSSRFQTQYGKDVTLQLVYESAGTCTCYALNGSDSTSSVTGIWRVLNYYDSNTTYSKMSQSEANTGTATDARTMTAAVLSTTINNKIAAIKQDGITGATVNRFGTCSTGASTAAKTVSVTSGTFSLEAGARVSVKFSNANTASTPTLNVGDTGAKYIYYKGSKITTAAIGALLRGVVEFIYDGTQWHLIGAAVGSESAASSGTDLSLVTTGEKNTWNNKQDALSAMTQIEADTGTATTARSMTAAVLNTTIGNKAQTLHGVTMLSSSANLNNYVYPTYSGEYYYNIAGHSISNMPTGLTGQPFRLIVESLGGSAGSLSTGGSLPIGYNQCTLQTLIVTNLNNTCEVKTYRRRGYNSGTQSATWSDWVSYEDEIAKLNSQLVDQVEYVVHFGRVSNKYVFTLSGNYTSNQSSATPVYYERSGVGIYYRAPKLYHLSGTCYLLTSIDLTNINAVTFCVMRDYLNNANLNCIIRKDGSIVKSLLYPQVIASRSPFYAIDVSTLTGVHEVGIQSVNTTSGSGSVYLLSDLILT